jgi:hypothetical protein
VLRSRHFTANPCAYHVAAAHANKRCSGTLMAALMTAVGVLADVWRAEP